MNQRLHHITSTIARKAQKASEKISSSYWHTNPFCESPMASKEAYMTLWQDECANNYPAIDTYEAEAGFAVDLPWMNELALPTQTVIKSSPLCFQHGRVVYAALRAYLETSDKSSVNIVETGTARGFSAVVMARALADAGREGRIVTYDLLPHHSAMYWNCVDDLEGRKTRAALLAPWRGLLDRIIFIEGDSRIALKKTALPRIDFAFLDGAHSYEDVRDEFALVAPQQGTGDVIMFDDYTPGFFDGLIRAVDEGCEAWGYDKHVIRASDTRAYVVATKRG